jgi:predicted O-methyltransferase YrrM
MTRVEADCHPHAPEERAQEFRCADGGSTEFEYLNLLHALILATKPGLVLETGTFHGLGTLAIAAALAGNGRGKLISVDIDSCDSARTLVDQFELGEQVDFHRGDSAQFCATWVGSPFEFAFFDSDMSTRHRECELLRSRRKLAPGALAVFHDASPLRYGVPVSWELTQYLRSLPGGITLPLSRGLRIWQQQELLP